MIDYTKLSAAELEAKAKEEDRDALREVGMRFRHEKNLDEARKYFIFSAQLGSAESAAELGDLYEAEGNLALAIEQYKLALMRGFLPVSCRLASLMMDTNETEAVEILVSSAVLGSEPSVKMLYEYYTDLGNNKEANYWKGKLKSE